MVIKIGGIEIKEGTTMEEFTQLTDGLQELGVQSISEHISWFNDLSISDKIELFAITDGYNPLEVADALLASLTFGLL